MPEFDLMMTIQILPAIIIGLTIHEFSHAYAAYLCWDCTAKDLWRISLNPIKHIDPFGFFLIIFAGFWWAKPVSFNKYNLRNGNRDVIKIAIAWPISNAILAIILSVIFMLLINNISETTFTLYRFFILMIYYGIFINWGLFLFNILPIPPLDGSHVFLGSCKNHPSYASLEKYWIIWLFIIFFIQSQTGLVILPISTFTSHIAIFFLKLFGYS
jgi:Zn-dependent protease